jgi:hypothetical protein
MFNKIRQKGEDSLKDFWKKTRQEAHQTKEAEEILIRYAEGKGVTIEEKKLLKTESIDIAKVIFIGIPLAVIPGFSVVMILLVKLGNKYKFNVLPSAFAKPKEENNKDNV